MTGPGPRLVRPADPDWPGRLTHLTEPPAALWVWGAVPPAEPGVAVVGARRATASGAEIARRLGEALAELGIQVISGMARGIDAAAHRGALGAGGSTVAVLGCGIDVCYPPEHQALRAEIVAGGAVLSEERRDAEPRKHLFPKRNRLIAALACAVVVVEADLRSGALSTARWAADLGREVLAVPGSIRSSRSDGTNRLIRDGCRPYLEVTDLLEAVPELGGFTAAAATGARRSPRLPARVQELFARLGPDPAHPDELGAALGLSPSEVASRLSELELAGVVMSLPGGLVARTV